MSPQLQYIIVFIILGAIIAWLIYNLLRKKPKSGSCCGCALADACNKRELKERIGESVECEGEAKGADKGENKGADKGGGRK